MNKNKILRWLFIFILAGMLFQQNQARATDLYVNTVSEHFWNETADQNEFNPGLLYVKDEWIVGGYYNTNHKVSLFIGKQEEFNTWSGYTYGLVTGYDSIIMPFSGLYLKWERARLNIFPGVISLSFKIK